jgi:hypothetical protein
LLGNNEGIGPLVYDTDRKPLIQVTETVAKNDWCGTTVQALIDTVGIDSRTFGTQDKLGATEVHVVFGNRESVRTHDSRVSFKCPNTLGTFRRIGARCKVHINLIRSFGGPSLEPVKKRELFVDEPEWNSGQLWMADGCIDGIDVMDVWEKNCEFAWAKRVVCIVNNHIEPFRPKYGELLYKLSNTVSVQKDPVIG